LIEISARHMGFSCVIKGNYSIAISKNIL